MLQFLISMLGFLRVVAGHSALCLSLPKDVLWEIIRAAFGRKLQTSPGFARELNQKWNESRHFLKRSCLPLSGGCLSFQASEVGQCLL